MLYLYTTFKKYREYGIKSQTAIFTKDKHIFVDYLNLGEFNKTVDIIINNEF